MAAGCQASSVRCHRQANHHLLVAHERRSSRPVSRSRDAAWCRNGPTAGCGRPAPGHGQHRALRYAERAQLAPNLRVPEPQRRVAVAGQRQPAVGGQRHAGDATFVPDQRCASRPFVRSQSRSVRSSPPLSAQRHRASRPRRVPCRCGRSGAAARALSQTPTGAHRCLTGEDVAGRGTAARQAGSGANSP